VFVIIGTRVPIYWCAAWLVDFAFYMIPVVATLLLCAAFETPALTGLNGFGAVLLFILFGLAVLPWTYAFTFAFEKGTTFQVVMSLILGILNIMVFMVVAGLTQFSGMSVSTTTTIIIICSMLLPTFGLTWGLFVLGTQASLRAQRLAMCAIWSPSLLPSGTCDTPTSWDVLAWNQLGASLLSLFITAVVTMTLTIALDLKWFSRRHLVNPRRTALELSGPATAVTAINAAAAATSPVSASSPRSPVEIAMVPLASVASPSSNNGDNGNHESKANVHAVAVEPVLGVVVHGGPDLADDIEATEVANERARVEAANRADLAAGRTGRTSTDIANGVAAAAGSGDAIAALNLHKEFPIKKPTEEDKRMNRKILVAVDRLTLAIPDGDCFGLIGPNGAGKSTSINIFTGDVTPTSGDAFLCGHSITTSSQECFANLGFCPQFDGLIDLMTGKEHLYLYARYRTHSILLND
jgi:ABC-type multidrug transport system fused ATPase/permease subunit